MQGGRRDHRLTITQAARLLRRDLGHVFDTMEHDQVTEDAAPAPELSPEPAAPRDALSFPGEPGPGSPGERAILLALVEGSPSETGPPRVALVRVTLAGLNHTTGSYTFTCNNGEPITLAAGTIAAGQVTAYPDDQKEQAQARATAVAASLTEDELAALPRVTTARLAQLDTKPPRVTVVGFGTTPVPAARTGPPVAQFGVDGGRALAFGAAGGPVAGQLQHQHSLQSQQAPASLAMTENRPKLDPVSRRPRGHCGQRC